MLFDVYRVYGLRIKNCARQKLRRYVDTMLSERHFLVTDVGIEELQREFIIIQIYKNFLNDFLKNCNLDNSTK